MITQSKNGRERQQRQRAEVSSAVLGLMFTNNSNNMYLTATTRVLKRSTQLVLVGSVQFTSARLCRYIYLQQQKMYVTQWKTKLMTLQCMIKITETCPQRHAHDRKLRRVVTFLTKALPLLKPHKMLNKNKQETQNRIHSTPIRTLLSQTKKK